MCALTWAAQESCGPDSSAGFLLDPAPEVSEVDSLVRWSHSAHYSSDPHTTFTSGNILTAYKQEACSDDWLIIWS